MKNKIQVKKERLSNFELLRLIAMFMVMVVHANFHVLGTPTVESYIENPNFICGQYFFQSLSIGCVNIFVLISGWFGIRPKIENFKKLIFQCFFFLCSLFLVSLIIKVLNDHSITTQYLYKKTSELFLLTKGLWFIKSYIMLMIIAPLLNCFAEKAEKKEFSILLISFFTFQTVYGWISNGVQFFENGYSTISFAGLYLLACYLKKYPTKWTCLSSKSDFAIFLLCVMILFSTALLFIALSNKTNLNLIGLSNKLFSYINPIVIMMSLYILLAFSKIKFTSKFINMVSSSCLAVYLFHCNSNIFRPFYCNYLEQIASEFDGLTFLLLTLFFLVFIYAIAILFDKIRIALWHKIS